MVAAFALPLAEAVAAKLEWRASGARAFWWQAKSLGNAGYENIIAREHAEYLRAEALATEAAEIVHALRNSNVADIFRPRQAA